MPTAIRNPLAAVPSECHLSLKLLGFDKIPSDEQMNWLKARFFRPSGWTESEDFAAVKSVRRIRKYCWRALAHVAAEEVSRETVVRGRPQLRRKKASVLQHVVHEPGKPLPASWQWPLVEIAVTSDLPPEESLWLLTRFTVLPDRVARLCALEVANAGARLVSYDANQAFTRYATLVRSGTLTEAYCGSARALLRGGTGSPYMDAHIVNAFEAVSSREPCFALRRAITHAGAACLEKGLATGAFLESFCAAIRGAVLREMV